MAQALALHALRRALAALVEGEAALLHAAREDDEPPVDLARLPALELPHHTVHRR
eukprot:CAMPEP_0204014378 /NCGR_PEP_ID=MMETSP0360-20130528/25350_1 /ASSEMBLY_ACC=CAM_ASM_000342 /TAXON_ID=268821 /ORGANISM="Scrippsiella Hangoei, Strain SHTV-5" /LENGTH=54 /DNA_ID=CAMNT_0050957217 /DNA_START=149 /DNA_END=311 /DNA_ORIENTATION=+